MFPSGAPVRRSSASAPRAPAQNASVTLKNNLSRFIKLATSEANQLALPVLNLRRLHNRRRRPSFPTASASAHSTGSHMVVQLHSTAPAAWVRSEARNNCQTQQQ